MGRQKNEIEAGGPFKNLKNLALPNAYFTCHPTILLTVLVNLTCDSP